MVYFTLLFHTFSSYKMGSNRVYSIFLSFIGGTHRENWFKIFLIYLGYPLLTRLNPSVTAVLKIRPSKI